MRNRKLSFFIFSLLLALGCGNTTQPSNTAQAAELDKASYVVTSVREGPENAEVAALVKKYSAMLGETLNEQIAVAAEDITMKGEPQNALGIFAADLLFKYMQDELKATNQPPIDGFVTNDGGLRVNLYRGPIRIKHIYELMPFDNALVVVTVTGLELQHICDTIAAHNGEPVSNISFTIDQNQAYNIKVNGEPLDLKKTYRIATSDYLAESGYVKKSLGKVQMTQTGYLMRDAIIEGLRRETQPIHAKKEGWLK